MYTSRMKFRILLRGCNVQQNFKYSNGIQCGPRDIQRALVVSKLSHYEFEVTRYSELDECELENKIRKRGTDFDKMMYYHKLHKSYECKVVKTLESLGIEVRVVNRLDYSEDLIEWADIIMPTGGDGTFLLAASRIFNQDKLVVGFNSDPNRSEGHLCLPKKYSTNIKEAIEKLQQGKFKWLMRSRIRTTLFGQPGKCLRPQHLHEVKECDLKQFSKLDSNGTVLPFLALNEVFIGESLSARVSHLGMWLNGSDQKTNLKCSGICISTGTGSTSWNLSINRLPVQSVAELLRLLDIDATEGKDSLATVLAKMYNNNLIFHPEDEKMCYTIRDQISAGVWPQPKGIKSRGFINQLKVMSNCLDACLVIDGGVSFPFNDGTLAMLAIHPEDALRTVVMDD